MIATRPPKGLVLGLLAGLSCGVLLGAGITAQAGDTTEALYRKLEVLAEVMGHVENHYVDDVRAESMVYGAARGVTSTLDEHSTFFSPDEYKSLVSTTEGEYAGLGIELGQVDGYPEILGVFEDSPAGKAELQRGDRIIRIDGQPTRGRDFESVYMQLRGPVGTKVVLEILRKGRNKPWKYTLVRSWIRLAPLEHQDFGEGIQYVRIKAFARRVAIDLEALLERHPPTKGLVLDLQGNPGGLFDEAVDISDLFLKEGPIVTVIGRGGRTIEERTAHPRALKTQPPIAILQDDGSASAAEVLAGALRDRKRARIFGKRSYGKGSVQSILDLSDGSGLKITIARYVTPSGRQIDGEGIPPDEKAPNEEKTLDKAMEWLRSQK